MYIPSVLAKATLHLNGFLPPPKRADTCKNNYDHCTLRCYVGQHVNPAGGAGGSRTIEHAGLQPTPLPLGYGASLHFVM